VRDTQAWFNEILEGSRDAIFLVDAQAALVHVNQAACDLSGYTRDELQSMRIPDLHDELDLVAFLTHFSSILDGAAVTTEALLRRKDGTKVPVEFSNRSVEIAGRRFVHTVARDVTERKQVLDALADSERRYRLLFETMAQGVVYQGSDGCIAAANPAALKILGLTLEQIQGRTSMDPRGQAVHEDGSDFPGDTHPFMQALRTGATVRSVMGVFNPVEDRRRWIDVTAVPQFRAGEASAWQVHTTFDDITERVEAGRALREIHELLGSLLEFAPIPIYVLTRDHRLRLVNRAWEEAMCRPAEQAVGRSLDELFPAENSRAFKMLSEEVFRNAAAATAEECLETTSGRRYFHTVKFPLRNARGEVETLGGISVDITNLKAAEDRARHDAALVRALASRLVEAETAERGRLALELHDRVGQSLTALGINFSLLRTQVADAVPGAAWRLDFLQSLIEDTIACVRDVMADLRPPMLDDYGPMSALRSWVKHLPSLSPVEIRIDSDDSKFRLPGPLENGLFRIAQEALNNVVKHAEATRATVSLDIDATLVRLVITDDGRGFIPPAAGDSIADEPRWGLLSMTERARAVGGRLTVESQPGHGTRIIVEVDR
jgi:two-component system sensor histidine kinase UhpB